MDKDFLAYYNILNFLTDSTGDYFFLLDVAGEKLYIPKQLRKTLALPNADTDYCTLPEWFGIVCPQDFARLQEGLVHALSGISADYDAEYRVMDRTGGLLWINFRGKVHFSTNGHPQWMMGRLAILPSHSKADHLTGAFHMDVLQEEIRQLLESGQDGFLLVLDVDDQQAINLKYGQTYGDQMLKQVADSLEAATGGSQRIYRMNGDSFAVNLPGRSSGEVREVFEQLQVRMRNQCTLSGGCVPYQTYRVPDECVLYQYAETAVDCAKAHGKKMLWFFSAEDYQRELAALELKEDLQRSVDNGFEGFAVFYQPQVVSHTYALHGAEALLRYNSPRLGPVSPTEFVPLLEDMRLICRVGLWVLSTALEQCRIWRQYLPNFSMSVNVSHVQLCDADITSQVLQCVERSGLPGSALTLELTEGIQLLDSPHINAIFAQWKQQGIAISIDDFGTGYSSLQRLEEMEIEEVKIDRCFVRDIHKSAYNYRFLGNMLQLADTSRIRVCCEGIETTEELAALEELRPRLLQGFLFSRPISAADFTARYFEKDSPAYQARLEQEEGFRRLLHNYDQMPLAELPPDDLAQAVLDAEEDIFYISDPETYELYYINPAGQRLFGSRDYHGKRCYKVLQGRDSPCPFCVNDQLDTDCFLMRDHMNEYCGRRFILRDKLILLHGKAVRLSTAIDITERELTSRDVQDRLECGKRMVEAAERLAECHSYHEAVRMALAILGEFYQADRVFLYKAPSEPSGHWTASNSTRWERPDLPPRSPDLLSLPPGPLRRWVEMLQRGQSVITLGTGPLQTPEERELLHSLDIHQHLAVPLLRDKKLLSFVGITNPRHCPHNDALARVVTRMLMTRMGESRLQHHLKELSRSNYRHILSSMSVGLWTIRMPSDGRPPQMVADETMYRALGAPTSLTPEECYEFWYSRINAGYYSYVHDAVRSMIDTGQQVQLEYTWNHPSFGEVIVQCNGIRVLDDSGTSHLQGYHRILSGTHCPQFLPELDKRELFEYNELKQTIFFHTDRHLIAGEQRHESGFPKCWIDNQIVHPHFSQEFQAAFSRVCLKSDLVLPEILLQSKGGTYEWFQLSLRHPGQEEVDLNTMVVSLEPIGPHRVQQLGSLRVQRFYHAVLAETTAHAELDLESGQLLSVGGLWRELSQDYRSHSSHFIRTLQGWLSPYLSQEDLALLDDYLSRERWASLLENSHEARRIVFRMPVDGTERRVELVIHLFQESMTQSVYALLYLSNCRCQESPD